MLPLNLPTDIPSLSSISAFAFATNPLLLRLYNASTPLTANSAYMGRSLSRNRARWGDVDFRARACGVKIVRHVSSLPSSSPSSSAPLPPPPSSSLEEEEEEKDSKKEERELKMLAYATWLLPRRGHRRRRSGDDDVVEPETKGAEEKAPDLASEVPEGYDDDVAARTRECLDLGTEQFVGNETVRAERWWQLFELATLPEYQRQGLAGRLIDWGMCRAREDWDKRKGDVEGVFVVRQPDAVGVYEAAGFEVVGRKGVRLGEGREHVFAWLVVRF